jgi:hypothetical protein
MPFSALAEAYENVAEARMPVNTLTRELNGFRPRLIDKKRNELHDHDLMWLLQSPDKITPFNVWMTRFLKSTLIFDAPALYIKEDHGNFDGLQYVDGSTIFLIVDEHGHAPLPNEISPDLAVQKMYLEKARQWLAKGKELPKTTPAYAQVIKGTPFGWYDQNQIFYQPTSRRFNSPYGETAIEQVWGWVLVVANITAFELAHYREGNMPEGWIEAGEGYNMNEVQTFESAFNARMSSGPAERMRLRVFPFGFKWHETKKPEFPRILYEQARDNIALSFGVPPSEYGKMPGQGLGGRGFGEAMMSALFRMGLMPRKLFCESVVNSILKRYGVDDATFELDLPVESADPDKQRESVHNLFSSGILTLNDALGQLGLASVSGGNLHMIIQGGQVLVLEDYLKDRGKTPPTPGGSENPPPDTGLPPNDGGPKTPEDDAIAEKILKSGKIDETTYSIPSGIEKGHLPPHVRGVAGRFAGKARVTSSEAQRLMAELDIDPLIHAPQAATEELGKPGGKIKFTKSDGLSVDDDAYFNAPVVKETQFDFPSDKHANDVEIVAMHPEGLESRPALFKPEGGELDNLQTRVGGKLYPREEAAYLLDRSLGFRLVPVAYAATVDGENGAVLYYQPNHQPSIDSNKYAPEWIEKAGILDYVTHQTDRNGGNFFTHPDDPTRPVLIDNGLGFPTTQGVASYSPFVELMKGKKLSDAAMQAITRCIRDLATWSDVGNLVLEDAANLAYNRLVRLLESGVLPVDANNLTPSDSSSASTDGGSSESDS